MEDFPIPILTTCLAQATLHLNDHSIPTNFLWRSTCKKFDFVFHSEEFRKQIQTLVELFISGKKDDATFFSFIFRRRDRFLFRKAVHCLPRNGKHLQKAIPDLFPPVSLSLTTEILQAIAQTSGPLTFKPFVLNNLIPMSANLDENSLEIIFQWLSLSINARKDVPRGLDVIEYQHYKDLMNRIIELDSPNLFSEWMRIRGGAKWRGRLLDDYRFKHQHLPRILEAHISGHSAVLFLLDHFERFRGQPHKCCKDYERIVCLRMRHIDTESACDTIIQYEKRLDEELIDTLILEVCQALKESILGLPPIKSSDFLSTFLSKMKSFATMKECIGILEEAMLKKEAEGYYFDHKYHKQLDGVKRYCNTHVEENDIQLHHALELANLVAKDMTVFIVQ